MPNERLRQLPSIESVLSTPQAQRLSSQLNRELVRDLIRDIIEQLRTELTGNSGEALSGADSLSDVIETRLNKKAEALLKPSLRRVINATGVILHTNLGRAPLAPQAVAAVANVAAGYSNLEYNIEKGER